MIDEDFPQNRKGGDSSLQTRVVVSVNPRRMSLFGREAVNVGAAGSLSKSSWRDASICVCAVCGSLGPSCLQREDGVLPGPGLLVLLSRDSGHRPRSLVGWRVRCQESYYLMSLILQLDGKKMGRRIRRV